MGSFFHGLSLIFPRFLDHSVEISLLICLIFLVKFLAPRKLPPWWHYALWLLLIVRMLVPIEFENRLSLFNFVPAVSTPQVSEFIMPASPEGGMAMQPIVLKPQVVEADVRFVAERLIPIIWMTGAMIFGICILFESITFWQNVRRRPKVTDRAVLSLLSVCKSRMKIKRKIDIVVTENVRCPALFGYVRPLLLLPEGVFEKLNDKELSYAFMHELGHLKRHDIGVSWIIAVLQVVHWFNPLVWLAFYQIRIDQETACDAAVLSRMKPKQSADYAKAIVGFLEKFCHNCQLPALAGVLENRNQMRRRIARIVQYRKSSQKLSFAAFVLLASIGFLLFTLIGVEANNGREGASELAADISPVDFSEPMPGHRPDDFGNVFQGFREDISGMDDQNLLKKGSFAASQFETIPVDIPGTPSPSLSDEIPETSGMFPGEKVEYGRPVTAKDMKGVFAAAAEGSDLQPLQVSQSGKNKVRDTVGVSGSVLSQVVSNAESVGVPPLGVYENGWKSVAVHSPAAERPGQTLSSNTSEQTSELAETASGAERQQAGLIAVLQQGTDPALEDRPVLQDIRSHGSLGDEGAYPNNVDPGADIGMMVKNSGHVSPNYASAVSARAEHNTGGHETPFQAEEVDTPPRLIKAYPPRYPYLAKRDDISGSIVLQFVVTKEGNAVDTMVVQSDPKGVFDQTVLKAVEQYRFKPGIKDGKAVDVRVNLPIKFNLT